MNWSRVNEKLYCIYFINVYYITVQDPFYSVDQITVLTSAYAYMLLGRPWCFLNHNNQCSRLLPRLNDVLVTILVISIIILRKLFYLKIKLKLLLSTLQ